MQTSISLPSDINFRADEISRGLEVGLRERALFAIPLARNHVSSFLLTAILMAARITECGRRTSFPAVPFVRLRSAAAVAALSAASLWVMPQCAGSQSMITWVPLASCSAMSRSARRATCQ